MLLLFYTESGGKMPEISMASRKLRELEAKYIQRFADYGYTAPKLGEKRHNKLHCINCNVVFYDGDPESSVRARIQFVIAKGAAIIHRDRSDHIIEFFYTQRAQ